MFSDGVGFHPKMASFESYCSFLNILGWRRTLLHFRWHPVLRIHFVSVHFDVIAFSEKQILRFANYLGELGETAVHLTCR